MAESNAALSTKLQVAGAPMVPAAFDNQVKGWYQANRKKVVSMAGGSEERAALFISAFYAQVNRVPKLMECKPETLWQCLIYSLGTNLMPGPMAEAYYIPFAGEAVFVPSYQGLMKLMYNSGFVTRITGHVVREHDVFSYNMATEEIFHAPGRGSTKDRGQRIGAYVIIKNIHGEIIPIFKDAEFIQGIRDRSPAARSAQSPWNSKFDSDVDAMWLKTVVRQAAKWVPKNSSPQGAMFSKALELDDNEGKIETAALLDEDVETIKQSVLGTTAEAL